MAATLPPLTREQVERLVDSYDRGWYDAINRTRRDHGETPADACAYQIGWSRARLHGMPARGVKQ